MSPAKVSVVVPALNEAKNLRHVLPLIPTDVHEVILVDGRSTDGTADVARSVLPGVRIVAQEGRGKGDALRCGFEAASGDIVVMLDADGSADPREIPTFVDVLQGGADFAKGSRFLPGAGTSDMTWYRKLGNLVFVDLVKLLYGGRYTDLCYGYNAFWRRVLPSLALDGNGFEIETMMNVRALKADLRIVEVPSFEHQRIHGVSNLRTIPDGWRVLKTIFRERFGTARQVAVPETTGRPVVAVPIESPQLEAIPVMASNEVTSWSSSEEPTGVPGGVPMGDVLQPVLAEP